MSGESPLWQALGPGCLGAAVGTQPHARRHHACSLPQVSDRGVYSCKVRNAAGEATRAFVLTVQGKWGPVCGRFRGILSNARAAEGGKGRRWEEAGLPSVEGTRSGVETSRIRTGLDLSRLNIQTCVSRFGVAGLHGEM